MYSMLLFIAISLFIPGALYIISSVVMSKVTKTREGVSPFECGFDPSDKLRSSFSVRFFLIMVLFLIFDIEIVLILPSPLLSLTVPDLFWNFVLIGFIFILSGGLLLEWFSGILEWT